MCKITFFVFVSMRSYYNNFDFTATKNFITKPCNGHMSCLSEIYLNETIIVNLPLSMEPLTELLKLDLTNYKSFQVFQVSFVI